MKIQTFRKLWRNERGMASFIVVFVLMLIMSLVTLSFAQVIRREQRQALDRHLSSQAFYAAESGVNVAINALNNGYAGSKPECGPDASGLLDSAAYTLDGPTQTELNCLTIDNSPTSLEYPNLVRNKSIVIPFSALSNFNRLAFSWQSRTATPATSYATCNAANGLTPQASWGCTAPLLRVDIVPTAGGLTRAGLTNSVYSAFFYPTSGAGTATANYTAGSRSNMINARCIAANAPNDCNVTLTVPAGSREFYLRIMPYYADANLIITPTNGANPVEVAGAQAVIDSTGKANDIIRRLQVRKSLTNSGVVPSFGIDAAAGLCKRYLVMAGNGTPGSAVLNLNAVGGGTLSDGGPCSISAAPPAGAVGGGSPDDGVADASTCPSAGCGAGGTGETGRYDYTKTVYNRSPDPVGTTIDRCTWNFGDGSALVTRPGAQCHNGDDERHTFPSIDEARYPYPAACHFTTSATPPREEYSVLLTQYFSNGTTASKQITVTVPGCP